MRLKAAGIGIAAAAIVAGPGAGMAGAGAADLRVVAAPGAASTGFLTVQTVVQKGKTASFLNLDIAAHDVVSVKRGSDGKPVFRSSLVPLGTRTQIAGVNRLAVGKYDFYCSLHPNMKGKLRVI